MTKSIIPDLPQFLTARRTASNQAADDYGLGPGRGGVAEGEFSTLLMPHDSEGEISTMAHEAGLVVVHDQFKGPDRPGTRIAYDVATVTPAIQQAAMQACRLRPPSLSHRWNKAERAAYTQAVGAICEKLQIRDRFAKFKIKQLSGAKHGDVPDMLEEQQQVREQDYEKMAGPAGRVPQPHDPRFGVPFGNFAPIGMQGMPLQTTPMQPQGYQQPQYPQQPLQPQQAYDYPQQEQMPQGYPPQQGYPPVEGTAVRGFGGSFLAQGHGHGGPVLGQPQQFTNELHLQRSQQQAPPAPVAPPLDIPFLDGPVQPPQLSVLFTTPISRVRGYFHGFAGAQGPTESLVLIYDRRFKYGQQTVPTPLPGYVMTVVIEGVGTIECGDSLFGFELGQLDFIVLPRYFPPNEAPASNNLGAPPPFSSARAASQLNEMQQAGRSRQYVPPGQDPNHDDGEEGGNQPFLHASGDDGGPAN